MSELHRKLFARIAQTGERLDRPAREAGPFPDNPSVQMDDARFIAGAMVRTKWADVEYYGPGAAAEEERRRVNCGLEPAPEVPDYAGQAEAVIAANTAPAKVRWLKRQWKRLGMGK
jgi:hypothetical protein